MKIREYLGLDYFLLFAAILLTLFGILFIYSSGIDASGELVSREYIRQIIWAASGVMLIILLIFIDYRHFYDLSIYLYAGIVLLLLFTCFFGRHISGARRAVGIGIFSFQPAEFAKISSILFLARYLDSSKRSGSSLMRFIIASAIIVIPTGLILMQPDLGTALVFIPIFLTMIFIAGFSPKYVIFLILVIASSVILTMLPYWEEFILKSSQPAFALLKNYRFVGLCSAVILFVLGVTLLGYKLYKKRYFYWILFFLSIILLSLLMSLAAHRILKEYQIMRLIIFLNPGIDPQGAGWNIIQSMTAIGSGGLWGKGFLQGTHSHYRFLPEQSTDFIFSIFGEEFGFLGGIFIFGLFLLIFLRIVRIMRSTADSYGLYIASGLAAMYAFHFLINVGMTMGIMPITGIPLYFMSYGGSALITAMAGIGISMSIYVRKYNH